MKTTENLKSWCSIKLDALAHNYNYTKSITGNRVIAVIKANAYGHGALSVAKRLVKEGCDFFAVATIEEALKLRDGGINCSVLVLGYILSSQLETAINNDISFAAGSLDFVKQLTGLSTTKKAKVHIKLDTGMNRTGFDAKEKVIDKDFAEALELIKNSVNIELEGVFSHMAKADDDKEFSFLQFERFMYYVDYMKECGLTPKIRHICNSAATLNYPQMYLDAVRLGIHLYGCESEDKNYLPTMEFCTRIVAIHTLKKGQGIGYGLDFKATEDMKIATIGAGYADGLFRCLSNGKGKLCLKGVLCPIVGRVCMDMAMIDISKIENVSVGDVVTIFGNGISCEDQAKNANTISYELMCDVSQRVTRVYI